MYSVDSPNSLWHLDGHHKLIRWKLVTHGAIDGKTRTIVFLKCSSNNRADTVLHQLQLAVEQFGLPSRVRTDKGGENIEVWRYMLHMHGTQTAVVAGSSTHNERIERLWHDMYRCVCCHYYERFYSLEEEQALDPLNETDLYCLHYVFVPRINRHLEDFVESWNNHSLSTEHNQTPYQLMLIGMDNQMPAQFQSLNVDYGSLQSLPVHLNTTQHVQVACSKFMPCPTLEGKFAANINPHELSHDFGQALYTAME